MWVIVALLVIGSVGLMTYYYWSAEDPSYLDHHKYRRPKRHDWRDHDSDES